MNFLKLIKQVFLFLLIILLGAQTTYAKTEFVLPQNQVSFSIEQSQSSKSLEKEVQPNIGFLKEKSKFGKSESISAQNQHEFSEIDVSNLANTVGKSKIITKLDALGDLSFAKKFVNSLDEVADAPLLSKLDELDNTQLGNLNTFYKNRPSPAGFGPDDFNFTATKTINGKSVSIEYKYGFPNFHKTSYCPEISYANGSTGKFKFEANDLTGTGKSDFNRANEALLDKIGLSKSNPKVNGYHQNGNYRWNGTSTQFELKNANGGWDKYTWHHIEDGKNMTPILSSVHSPGAGQGGFVHPGGNAIIQGGIKDIFKFTGF